MLNSQEAVRSNQWRTKFLDPSSVILPLSDNFAHFGDIFFCEDYQKTLDKNIFFIWLKKLIRKANHDELSRS